MLALCHARGRLDGHRWACKRPAVAAGWNGVMVAARQCLQTRPALQLCSRPAEGSAPLLTILKYRHGSCASSPRHLGRHSLILVVEAGRLTNPAHGGDVPRRRPHWGRGQMRGSRESLPQDPPHLPVQPHEILPCILIILQIQPTPSHDVKESKFEFGESLLHGGRE